MTKHLVKYLSIALVILLTFSHISEKSFASSIDKYSLKDFIEKVKISDTYMKYSDEIELLLSKKEVDILGTHHKIVQFKLSSDGKIEKKLTFIADNNLEYQFIGLVETSTSYFRIYNLLDSTNKLSKIDIMILLFANSYRKPISPPEIIKNDNEYFTENYDLDLSNTKASFILLNYDEFISMDNTSQPYIVVATRNDCPYCHTIMPKYITVSNDLNLSEIYFIDINTLRAEEKENLRTEYGINVVPTSIIKLSNGSKEIIYGDIDEVDLKDILSKLKEDRIND